MLGYSDEYKRYQGWQATQFKQLENRTNRREVANSELGLLIPAFIGTGAFFLLTQMFGYEGPKEEQKDPISGKIGSIIYTSITTAGISLYIYNVIVGESGAAIYAFLPVSGALAIMMLYYAAVYNWVYRLDPQSFSGEIDGNPLNEIVTFIYFSITTFSTAGMGEMSPISNTAKILVSLQVLFFVFIFTMGMVFFIGAT